ncbi:YihY/virulence factor BrkB family protein [Alkalicoccus luteus]|uniref:YihY/virulence factor BrkB family protein n=1 Tax=Alkalicoccus luteus TaxID=1237094 RepID=A0A969PXA6_9BACI|nr:YihY/virulence factor BrkB family protein [Alkalicoccus luteus]NJP37322.1 YihY/virulence factor BrkB family protein [Alkalicoccus luteus]
MWAVWKEYALEIKEEWSRDDVPLLAAAQAYYYVLSVIPLMILLLAVLPYFQLDPDQVLSYAEEFLPEAAVDVFEDTIVDAVSEPNGGLLTVGILGTIWSASNGMNAFIQAINTAFNVTKKRSFLKHRGLSILLTLLLLLSLITTLFLPIFGEAILDAVQQVVNMPPQAEMLIQAGRWIVAILVVITILTALYTVAPNMKIPFKSVIPGAVAATIGWMAASYGFSIYISNFGNFSATYGSLGGMIILMLWMFLTGIILLIGAEINAIHFRRQQGR